VITRLAKILTYAVAAALPPKRCDLVVCIGAQTNICADRC